MVKGLIFDQTEITQELKQDVSKVKKQLDHITPQLERLDQIEGLLIQIFERLPKNPE